MKAVFWAFACLLGAWTARGVFSLVVTLAAKVGAMSTAGTEFGPFVAAVTWWQLGMWGIAYALFTVAIGRYLFVGSALRPLSVGVAIDVALYLTFRPMPAYQALTDDVMIDQLGLVGLVTLVGATWWLERKAKVQLASG